MPFRPRLVGQLTVVLLLTLPICIAWVPFPSIRWPLATPGSFDATWSSYQRPFELRMRQSEKQGKVGGARNKREMSRLNGPKDSKCS